MRRHARPAAHSSPAPLPCNRISSSPAAVPRQSPARKLMNTIQTPLRCCCSVTAVCRFSSAVFLGAPPLLNCYCADTSVTMHATNDLSSSLPLLSFVTSFAVSTHLHDSSDSSYQRFNLMPCFPLRQVVCQILFARDSSHFYSS